MIAIFYLVRFLWLPILGTLGLLLIVYYRHRKLRLQDRVSKDYYEAATAQVIPNIQDEKNVVGKVAVVTGANAGIGRATAVALAKRGATVIMGCRDLTTSKQAKEEMKRILDSESRNNLILMKLDLGDFNSIEEFVSEFKKRFSRLHILINNAGVLDRNGKLPPTADGFEPNIGINHLGHFYLTSLLLESLMAAAPSRVVTLTSFYYACATMTLKTLPSILSQIDQTRAEPDPSHYANSKYANILFSKELGSRLLGTKVNTYAVCPGLVETSVIRHENWWARQFMRMFLKFRGMSREEGAQTVLMCALSKKLGSETGGMYRFGRSWANPVKEIDEELMKNLWEQSESITLRRSSLLNKNFAS